jgi:hypothetical protein
MDFNRLRTTNDLAKLQQAVEKQSKKRVGDNPDEYWLPTLDKAGNGSAKVRLLPSPPQDGEDGLPWAMYWRYAFQGNGGWYINKSLATLDLPDPCAEYTHKLYSSKLEANIAQAKKMNRQVTYEVNVEILQDPAAPENDGLVRKWKFGKKIFAKIDTAMKGTEDIAPFNPFDLFGGADFRIKIEQIVTDGKKFPNYDKSHFLTNAPRSTDNKFLESLWNQCFSLKDSLDPKSFKSYDELLKDLTRALGFNPFQETRSTVKVTEREVLPEAVKTIKDADETPPWEKSSTDEEFGLDYFKSLTE